MDLNKKIVLTTTQYDGSDVEVADELVQKVRDRNIYCRMPAMNIHEVNQARSEVTFNIDGIDYEAFNDFEKEEPGASRPKVTPLCLQQQKDSLQYLISIYQDAFKYLKKTLDEFMDDVIVNKKKARRPVKGSTKWLEYYRRLCLINMNLDDYRTKVAFLAEICKRLGWKPVVDLATNPIGSNSVCLLFFSAMVDALKQVEYIKGKKVMVNPVF